MRQAEQVNFPQSKSTRRLIYQTVIDILTTNNRDSFSPMEPHPTAHF